ncbi:Protein of unknown function (DUF3775) [Thioflavicoccus mobilis 8321]|uniref:DUF3775 domain-containing protein n=1 Tax=Thioflavicoccus mobilis 8321 TaxID=765912 RepID=L0GW36_9GAMM|nr:DUF3775 domain-containing protein [Thioflavicoccus mobilis]AGA90206.1 Protein of unknown function (DUF3775) [Thioflavicoccus mobilis 8321]
MLHIRLEALCFIIAKAREFQAKEGVVIPESPENPSDDWAMQVLADHGNDYSVREIQDTLAEFNGRQRAELIALMWLGRGDYDIEEWEVAVDDALGDLSVRAAEYLLAHPMVSDYLEEGLIAHGYYCNE